MNNILDIVKNNNCVGCSVCIPICPIDIINVNHKDGFLRPDLNDSLCLDKCSLCLDICPAKNRDDDLETNSNSKYYIAYSKSHEIRLNGQSGGFITQYLIELFKQNLIDCAVVSILDIKTGHNKSIIVDKNMDYEKLLLQSSGSKYTSSIIDKDFIKRLKKYKQIVYVGLPCQLNALSHIKALQKKLYCKIGLVCDRVISENFSKLFINAQTKDFKYRSKKKNGYPGDVCIIFNDKKVFIDKRIRHRLKFLYTQPQCFECDDKNAKYADIVVGDNYIKKYKDDKIGTSIVEDRNNFLAKLNLNNLSLIPISKEEYHSSVRLDKKQEIVLKYKNSIFFKQVMNILAIFHSNIFPIKLKIIVSVAFRRIIEKVYGVKL